MSASDGGAIIGATLASRGVRQLFTLCGGHISPILVGAKAHGLQVIDVRDEASAVFAADAGKTPTGMEALNGLSIASVEIEFAKAKAARCLH